MQGWKTYASVWIHEKDSHSRIGIKTLRLSYYQIVLRKKICQFISTRKRVAGVTGAFKVHYLVFLDGALFKGLLQQVMVKAATNINL